jgi:hypothetical protein
LAQHGQSQPRQIRGGRMAAFKGCNRNMDLDLTSNKCKGIAIAETRERDQAMNALTILA